VCWNGHEDFQSYSPVFVSARNSLLSKETFTTASCAGVRWNDQECAGVGHKLGTRCLLDHLVRRCEWGHTSFVVIPVDGLSLGFSLLRPQEDQVYFHSID